MPVIGLQLKSVKASIDEKKIIEGNINVNSSPRIESVEKKDINVPGIKDVLSINFIFEVNYDPKVGEIEMEGEVLYQTDKSKYSKQLLRNILNPHKRWEVKHWKRNINFLFHPRRSETKWFS